MPYDVELTWTHECVLGTKLLGFILMEVSFNELWFQVRIAKVVVLCIGIANCMCYCLFLGDCITYLYLKKPG